MSDKSCLAEGYVVEADFAKTGLNLNELIVGTTGCGKSVSNVYSRLLHTNESSVVVPIAKKAVMEQFSDMFLQRGYEVIVMDYSHPEKSNCGYDPLDYVHSEEDVVQLARNLIGTDNRKNRNGDADPYWNESAISVLAAEIALVRMNAEEIGIPPRFNDVIRIHRSMRFDLNKNQFSSNLDTLFHKAEVKHPGNQASSLWKTIEGLASRTASCILSIVNSAIDKISTESVVKMMKKPKHIDFKTLGSRKTAVFIVTSPMNFTLQNLVNLMYADMFRELFEVAESNYDGRLTVPVHIICDDFACGSRINHFEDYISIFRAAGISVTLLLQSESQLEATYDLMAATTIINNCDTYVYMGGMDTRTAQNIAYKLNKPLHYVLNLPLEKVVVLRRGFEPRVARRYQTFDDPVYIELQESNRAR